jgi:hypothetical protein
MLPRMSTGFLYQSTIFPRTTAMCVVVVEGCS